MRVGERVLFVDELTTHHVERDVALVHVQIGGLARRPVHHPHVVDGRAQHELAGECLGWGGGEVERHGDAPEAGCDLEQQFTRTE